MYISVVICTYNRVGDLKKVLISISKQTIGQERYEVIVVDNACDEHVKRYVESISNQIRNIKYRSEPRLGLQHARNLGASIANGDWIIYLDDDAVPEKNWLEKYTECIESSPLKSVIGGTVLLSWLSKTPKWLTSDFYPNLSICRYKGNNKGFILNFPREYPVGANMAVRREVLSQEGGFDPELDRRGKLLLSGGETMLIYKLQQAGYPIWFCPGAVVHHKIPESRMTKAFFRSRYYWAGCTLAILHFKVFGMSYLINQLVRRTLGGLFTLFGYIYTGVWVKKNLFLSELWCREFFGYLLQGWKVVWSSFWQNNRKLAE